jgi:hypothetical protein
MFPKTRGTRAQKTVCHFAGSPSAVGVAAVVKVRDLFSIDGFSDFKTGTPGYLTCVGDRLVETRTCRGIIHVRDNSAVEMR